MVKIFNKKCPACGGESRVLAASKSTGIAYRCDECGERFALKQTKLSGI